MQKQGKFILMTRDEFRTWLMNTKFTRKIKLIQNHHTYLPDYSCFKGDNYFKMVEGMEASHKARGFSEIAQNITTFPNGMIMICRSFDVAPAGIKGANSNGICMENVGNFDKGGDIMTAEQKKTIILINAMLCIKFGLKCDLTSIVYHRWYNLETGKRINDSTKGSYKTCPGTAFFGGNTTQSALKNFVPLIQQQINAIKKPTPTPQHKPTPKPTTPLKQGIVTTDLLNCRALPSANAKINGKVKKGTKLNIYSEKDGFYLVNKVNPQWVAKQYISIIK